MPNQAITDTPVVLADLLDGVFYTVQAISKNTVFVEAASAVPTDISSCFRLAALGDRAPVFFSVSKAAGEEIYIWAPAAGGHLVYDEAD